MKTQMVEVIFIQRKLVTYVLFLNFRFCRESSKSQSNVSEFHFTQALQGNVINQVSFLEKCVPNKCNLLCFLQINLTYDGYLKLFYKYQEENVFTQYNWTLSDEVIKIIKSNFFYTQHVIWNFHQFRPFDVVTDEARKENEVEILLTQLPYLH